MSFATQITARQQQGVSLIDAMIAVLIFSVGLLAVASLQAFSKQSNYEAIQRSYAATMAFDLFERMRMNSGDDNVGSALSYYVNTTTVSLSYTTTETAPVIDCATTNCTYQQMSDWDVYNWWQSMLGGNEVDKDDNTKLYGGLIDPTVCLSGPGAGASGEYRLTIVWRGQAAIPDTHGGNNCGTGQYDDAPGDNAFRRIMVINTYLNN
jgi:type IV pilus assembly protein PilV